MTANEHSNLPSRSEGGLAYNGVLIRDRDEMLSLTDMWKAAGSDDARRPANWARKEGADFIAHMRAVLNVPDGHIIATGRGRNGATYAHWQIALAYAKYLSPEFHMWCNTVVRERMEGKPAPVVVGDMDQEVRRAIGGMLKGIVQKAMREGIDAEIEARLARDPRVAALNMVSVKALLEEAGAVQHGRRSLNLKIGYAMRSLALTSPEPIGLRRCPHSGVWLFPRDFADQYMKHFGLAMVREHNDRNRGQGRLTLVGGGKKKEAEKRDDAVAAAVLNHLNGGVH